MPDSNLKPDLEMCDPARIEELFELELRRMRAGWRQARAMRKTFRALAYLFLFLVIVAALAAIFLVRP